jgi:hypothetical protein
VVREQVDTDIALARLQRCVELVSHRGPSGRKR